VFLKTEIALFREGVGISSTSYFSDYVPFLAFRHDVLLIALLLPNHSCRPGSVI